MSVESLKSTSPFSKTVTKFEFVMPCDMCKLSDNIASFVASSSVGSAVKSVVKYIESNFAYIIFVSEKIAVYFP